MDQKVDLLNSNGPSFLIGPAYFGQSLQQTGSIYLYHASSAFSTLIQGSNVTADRTFTVPESGANASFVMTQGTQTISGIKTFDTQFAVS